jgi:hypothetical protein
MPGFFQRLCCGAPESEPPAPSATSATPLSRASSNERSPSRRSFERASNDRHSVNPIAAVLSAVQGSVETVARGSRASEFKDIASRCVHFFSFLGFCVLCRGLDVLGWEPCTGCSGNRQMACSMHVCPRTIQLAPWDLRTRCAARSRGRGRGRGRQSVRGHIQSSAYLSSSCVCCLLV